MRLDFPPCIVEHRSRRGGGQGGVGGVGGAGRLAGVDGVGGPGGVAPGREETWEPGSAASC